MLPMTNNAVPFVRNDLRRWFERCIEVHQPGLIVGISRAAPRMLEVIYGYGSLRTIGIPVVSDIALSFLQEQYLRNKKVLIVDDCVNYGSSMYRVKSRLLSMGLSDEQISCAAYAVDRDVYLRSGDAGSTNHPPLAVSPYKKSLRVHFKYALPNALMPSFHNFIVETVRHLAKPYNLDFPIFLGVLTDEGAQSNDLEWRYRVKRLLPTCEMYPISTRVTYPDWLSVFSIPVYALGLPQSLQERRPSLEPEHYSKIRIYLDRKNKRVHLAPMFIPRWKPANGRRASSLSCATGIWNAAVHAVGLPEFKIRPSSSPMEQRVAPRVDQCDAVYELIVFLNSLTAFSLIWSSPFAEAWKGFFEEPGPTLSMDDCFLLLGPELWSSAADKLSMNSVLAEVRQAGASPEVRMKCALESDVDEACTVRSTRHPVENHELVRAYKAKMAKPAYRLQFGLSRRFSLEENFSRLLLVLREVIDEDRRNTKVNSTRLRDGFTFRDIMSILRRGGAVVPLPHLSLLMDCFIDLGMIVPVVMNLGDRRVRAYRSGESADTWVRAYRSGESVDAMNKLKVILAEGLQEWEQSGSGFLSVLDLSKIFAVLHEMFPIDVQVLPEHDVYGVVCTVNGQRIDEWAKGLRLVEFVQPGSFANKAREQG